MGIFKRKKKEVEPSAVPELVVTPDDPWYTTSITHEQGQVFLELCILELKSRPLDTPLLFYPFRPDSDHAATQLLIRRVFSNQLKGPALKSDLKITDSLVLLGGVRWVLSRLQDGIMTFDEYILFLKTEQQLHYPKDAFSTIITTIVTSKERFRNLNNYLDLLAAIASYGQTNGHSGRKLARVSAGLLFQQYPRIAAAQRFEEGYRLWTTAANASEHLFLAYLRDKSSKSTSGISMIPVSLQKVLDCTDYPLRQTSCLEFERPATCISLSVEEVSPTPFALVQRLIASKEQAHEIAVDDLANNPLESCLTDECMSVLRAIQAVNAEQSERQASTAQDAAWKDFTAFGFSNNGETTNNTLSPRLSHRRLSNASTVHKARKQRRPMTPDWSQFINAGFQEPDSHPVMLPMHLHLPEISAEPRSLTSQYPKQIRGHCSIIEKKTLQIDEGIWGAWIGTLASESNTLGKGFFGRAVILQIGAQHNWLIVEECVKGAEAGSAGWRTPASSVSRKKTTKKNIVKVSDMARSPSMKAAEDRVQALIRRRTDNPASGIKTVPYAHRTGRVTPDNTKELYCENLGGEAQVAFQWAQVYDRDPGRFSRSSVFALKALTIPDYGQSQSTDDAPSQQKDADKVDKPEKQISPIKRLLSARHFHKKLPSPRPSSDHDISRSSLHSSHSVRSTHSAPISRRSSICKSPSQQSSSSSPSVADTEDDSKHSDTVSLDTPLSPEMTPVAEVSRSPPTPIQVAQSVFRASISSTISHATSISMSTVSEDPIILRAGHEKQPRLQTPVESHDPLDTPSILTCSPPTTAQNQPTYVLETSHLANGRQSADLSTLTFPPLQALQSESTQHGITPTVPEKLLSPERKLSDLSTAAFKPARPSRPDSLFRTMPKSLPAPRNPLPPPPPVVRAGLPPDFSRAPLPPIPDSPITPTRSTLPWSKLHARAPFPIVHKKSDPCLGKLESIEARMGALLDQSP